jgi:ribosomal protein L11 methyltransferase
LRGTNATPLANALAGATTGLVQVKCYKKVVARPLPEYSTDESEGLFSALASQFNSCGLEIRDGDAETRLAVFFHSAEDAASFASAIGKLASVISIEDQPQENWQENWREYFKPVQVTPRIRIAPSWLSPSERATDGTQPPNRLAQSDADDATGLTIWIEPGMAFGTGTHATTQLCLRMIEKHLSPGCTVLEAGGGSGILCIAAARLGARFVAGFDIDPAVLENVSFNFRLNGVKPAQVQFFVGELNSLRIRPFDLLICNMLSREFTPLLPNFTKHLNIGGKMILSGFLATEQDETAQLAKSLNLDILDKMFAEEWAGFVVAPARAR